MKHFTMLLFVLALSACHQEQAASEAAPAAAAVEPAKPTPMYAMREKGKFGYEYGYEKALSEDDRQHGQAASQIFMMRFHGMKDGVYQLSSNEGRIRVVIECALPCEFFKQTIWSNTTRIKTEHLRLTQGSVAWAIMQDAQNGFLEPMSKTEHGKLMRAWVTDEGPRWELATETPKS